MIAGRVKLCCHNGLHLRPAGIVVKVANFFAKTDINIYKGVGKRYAEAQVCNAKSLNVLVGEGGFLDGEEVTLEVRGEAEELAFDFMKVAWENLGRFSSPTSFDTAQVEKNIFDLIDNRFLGKKGAEETRILDRAADSVTLEAKNQRFLAVTNDRLHRFATYALVRICHSMRARVSIAYSMGSEGVYLFDLGEGREHDVVLSIWQHSPDAGSRVTVIAKDASSVDCAAMVAGVLSHFHEFDDWLRVSKLDPSKEGEVGRMISFVRGTFLEDSKPVALTGSCAITNALPLERVLVFENGVAATKERILRELCLPHAVQYNVPVQQILLKIMSIGSTQLREGFVYVHCKLPQGPRVSASLAKLPSPIRWFNDIEKVQLVLLAVGAADTPRSHAEFIRAFAQMVYREDNLIPRLIAAETSRDAFGILMDAEKQNSQ